MDNIFFVGGWHGLTDTPPPSPFTRGDRGDPHVLNAVDSGGMFSRVIAPLPAGDYLDINNPLPYLVSSTGRVIEGG
ncbi:hypothetical protein M8C21_015858, partial [Ambrosia artemisiifolia]